MNTTHTRGGANKMVLEKIPLKLKWMVDNMCVLFNTPNILYRRLTRSSLSIRIQHKIVIDKAEATTSSCPESTPPPCNPRSNAAGYLQKNSPELTFQDQLRLAGIQVKRTMKDGEGKITTGTRI